MRKSRNERFFEKIEMIPFHSCWEWIGNKNHAGYGRLQIDKESIRAHRLSWIIHHGPISEDMFVCHKCDNPGCVNPNHLFVGSHSDNMADMYSKNRDNKPKGSKKWNAKLSEYHILTIRSSILSSRELGQIYGVSHKTILSAIKNKTWKHL